MATGNQIAGRRSAKAEPSTAGSNRDSSPNSGPLLPLINLSILGNKMSSLRRFLSDSVNATASISDEQIRFASSEISSAVHDIISNAAALVSAVHPPDPDPKPAKIVPDPLQEEEIMEIDAVELMADHVHSCEICGKGFKRDANLRMHMRAHGNRFKSIEALAKPDPDPHPLPTRFSCPVPGCGRNRTHKRFRPLKSVACVKNHFKRSHCPKLFSCERCKEKSFAVAADLRSHMRSCGSSGGERKWRCSCGTSFSRKDKLFGHVALFEGHLPAVNAEEQGQRVVFEGGADEREQGLDPEFFDGLMEEIDNFGMPYMGGIMAP